MSKIAIVTGGGRGIGAAVSEALVGGGFTVVICGRNPETLDKTAARIGATPIPTDVSDSDSVAALFADVGKRFGRLDLLFNNAGTNPPPVSFGDLEPAAWRKVIDTNLNGAFYCAREAFRMMKAQQPQGGRIINNGSISAHAPRPGAAPYTASKHAITGLTKQIALDGRVFDIACGQIDIGNAASEMTERMVRGVPQPDGRMMPEPRMDVTDIGSAVLYMANLSPASNVLFMTVMATKMPFVGRG